MGGRAQSKSVRIILLTFVIVVTVGIGGAVVLDVRWDGPGIGGEQAISESRLYRNATPTTEFTDTCVGSSCTFDVSGLSSDSRRFRLEIDLDTSSPTTTPIVDRLELAS